MNRPPQPRSVRLASPRLWGHAACALPCAVARRPTQDARHHGDRNTAWCAFVGTLRSTSAGCVFQNNGLRDQTLLCVCRERPGFDASRPTHGAHSPAGARVHLVRLRRGQRAAPGPKRGAGLRHVAAVAPCEHLALVPGKRNTCCTVLPLAFKPLRRPACITFARESDDLPFTARWLATRA